MVKVILKNHTLNSLKKYCKLVGFYPYDLERKGNKVYIKFSLKSLIWTYFLAVCMTILGTYCVVSNFLTFTSWFSPTYVNTLIVIYIVHFNFLFNIMSAVFCIVYTTFNRMKLNVFINNIIRVDELLGQQKIPIKRNRWSKVLAAVIIIFLLLIILADTLSYFLVFEKTIFFKHILRKFPYYSSYFFTTSQTFMFWSLVLLVRARILAVKEAIMGSDESLRFDKSYFIREFQDLRFRLRKTGKSDLKTLQQVYICLFNASRGLDRLLRPIIVLNFLTRFFSLLITPFILYVQITGYKGNFFIVSQTFWAVGQFSSLALIVEPAFFCRKEYEEFRRELSRLLCQEAMFNSELVILYDLVRALPIEFYINDASPLRRTLYVSILGSLTTYLVVLFQIRGDT